jgi:O-antigen/teichoic acid export membrane protein
MANQVIQVVLSMGSFALLSRWLVPYDYGLFGMAATVTAFVGVVGDVGVSSAVVRLAHVDAVAEASAFWLAIGGAMILTAITAIAAPLVAWFYRVPAITPLALGLAANFLMAAPGRVPGAMLARGLRLRATTIIGVITNVASVVLAVGLASRGFGAWALVAQALLSAALGSLLSCVAAPPTMRLGLVSRLRAREMAGFSSRLSGFSFATMLGRSLDNVLAGRLLGSGAVGLMTMGARLIFVPIERVSGAIYSVFLPALAQLPSVERQAAAFQSTLRLLFIAVGPLALGTVAIAPEIVALLPPKWVGLAPLLRVYAITALLLPINYLSLSVLVGHGRASVLLRTSVALIPICWAGATLGALSGSVLVMTLAWSFAITVGVSVAFWFAWGELKLKHEVWRSIMLPLAVSAAMAMSVWATVHAFGLGGKRAGFAVGAATGAVIYVALLQFTMAADVSRIVTLLRRSLARPKAAR